MKTLLFLLATGIPQAGGDTPDVPAREGEWFRIASPPKLERFATGKEQTVDFTIFRAGDGTWQLISCIRKTSHPGSGRLLYRWEAARLTQRDWTPKGIFLTADPNLGHQEGKVQAPHAVVEDGTWWLFFSSGGAFALKSEDGKNFTSARSASGASKFFDMPRDLMIFDNRARDGKWYAFYTDIKPGRYEDRRNHTVSFRTAPALKGPWSASSTDVGVVSPPPAGYPFVYAESPFILFRKGWFYRFEQLHILASRSIDRWTAPRRASLAERNHYLYLAPEVIVDGERTYLAAYKDHGKAGIFLTELRWRR